MPGPRTIAIGILRRGDEILVFDVPDDVKGVTGYRSPGGGIELGESGEDAIVREIREELGAEVTEPRYVGTVENIFTYLGRPGHEIVHVYEVTFADRTLYERDRFECVEANLAQFICAWRSLEEFRAGTPLYPEGLLHLLDG